MDYSTLKTPELCYVDFCLLPLGTGSPSVANEIAEVQKLIRSSGLKHTMHSAGTTIEGSWDDVMGIVGKAHTLVHQKGVARVQTSMRAGSRTDKVQHFEDKVKKVEDLLSKDAQSA
ncbi:related to ECM15 protein, involved in cell wall biogenesis and architecture [Cephalotrichum gorgonifer]|uniref:Related to ECM15 protein, involved in cell wall biogenesis and architecture n=1 Tax=Cephalotrichum gorgonifer TaxID=2041049 RepID=A0AAE8MRP2_9PEZI|nr:related to ECM15 protein, involved in cell wall biogenesis and architecture [Cephalotrichum gorgonifer]